MTTRFVYRTLVYFLDYIVCQGRSVRRGGGLGGFREGGTVTGVPVSAITLNIYSTPGNTSIEADFI